MSESRTFLDACTAGEALPNDIEEWIDRWHTGSVPDESLTLAEFLGFSDEEWKRWLGNPDALEAIVLSRRPGLPRLHVIVTDRGEFGWSIESPQLPELVGGRPTLDDLLADAPEMLRYAGAGAVLLDSAEVAVHEQHVLFDPDGREYLVRWQIDGDNLEDRVATAERIAGAITEGFDEAERLRHPRLVTNEYLFVACVKTDTVAWLVGQLGPSSRAVLAEAQGDIVWFLPFGQNLSHDGKMELDEIGLTFESTFADMTGATLAAEVTQLAAVQNAAALHLEGGMTLL